MLRRSIHDSSKGVNYVLLFLSPNPLSGSIVSMIDRLDPESKVPVGELVTHRDGVRLRRQLFG